MTDDKEWIDSFVIRKGERIAVKTKLPEGQPVRRRSKTAFAMVPLHWIAELAKVKHIGTAVALMSLLFAAWEAKGRPFVFSNKKLVGRCSSQTKMRLLSELQAIGWIEFSQTGKQAPVVTFLKE